MFQTGIDWLASDTIIMVAFAVSLIFIRMKVVQVRKLKALLKECHQEQRADELRLQLKTAKTNLIGSSLYALLMIVAIVLATVVPR